MNDPWIYAGLCFCVSLILVCAIVWRFTRKRPTKIMQAPVRDGRSSIVYLKDHVRH